MGEGFEDAGGLGGAILIVYAVRELDMSPATIGIIFSVANAGPLLAAFTANRLSARIGVGPTILATSSTILPPSPGPFSSDSRLIGAP